MCPPVLVGALYALRADTQVRPYTNHINTTNPAIKCCNTSSIIDRRTQKDLARGPTNHSRGSEGQSSERPTDARRHLIYRPLVGRTRRIYSSSPTSRQGRSSPPYTHLCPPVVRSFAPSTGGYDSSDRKRSLPPSPALVLLHNNETSNVSIRCRTVRRVTKCRDARLVRPLHQRLQHRDFNGDGRPFARH